MAFWRIVWAFTLLSCSFNTVLSGPISKRVIQGANLQLPPDAKGHRDAVVKIFTDSYDAYMSSCGREGHDNLSPVSGGCSDGRNGWGASIIDAMSTMKIMGLDDRFKEAVDFASKIDFSKSKTPDSVSVFETTIRYMGGLLSAYELNGKVDDILLTKAKEVGDKMTYAWVGDNDVPFGHIDFTTNLPETTTSNIAEAGTLVLEWGTLSKHTGDEKYRGLAEKAIKQIMTNPAPLPGLPPQGIDPSTGKTVGGYVTWGGGSDSYFEYLIKYPHLYSNADPLYLSSWLSAVDSSIMHLAKKSTVGNWLYLADFDSNRKIRHISSHLACFHGGNWIYGGKMLNNQTIIDHGLQLTDACWNTYASTATGIGPEVFAFKSEDGEFTGGSSPSGNQNEFYDQHGFYITAPDYILRPEVLESNFYAWRATGDPKYINRATSAVQSFQRYLAAKTSYAGIWNVDNVNSPKIDDMESFWFAEVLKYLYLTFDDPDHLSLDKYVFNTEAHPFLASDVVVSSTPATPEEPKPFKVQGGELPQISSNPYLPRPLKDILGLNL